MTYRYVRDQQNDLMLLNCDNGYQVMMEWEKQYMVDLIEKLNPSGKVLEIGFGLGISASEIQKYDIESHTIIERDPEVLKVAHDWASKQNHTVYIVEGKWQNALHHLGTFDSIFFDDSPDVVEDELDLRGYKFFYDILKSHVNANCRYSWFCSELTHLIVNPFVTYDVDIKQYDIPDYCEYTSGNEMYLPLMTFKRGGVDINRVMVDKYLNIHLDK